MNKLTILTEPISIYDSVKIGLKKILIPNYKYGGHSAVTRSLIEGLDKIGFHEYNYRPHNESEIAEHVHVLAGVRTLEYAIRLKQRGKIKKLTAGPNIVVFSTDHDSIIAKEEVDLYLQPSQWAADLHIKMQPSLEKRCVAWPAGVDVKQFDNAGYIKKGRQVLVYHKEESEQFCYRVCHKLRKHGFNPVVIKYGSYSLPEYMKALGESDFAVVISRQESQGIFLAEAWAMDIFTVCFDSHYFMWKYDDFSYELEGNISTCPYLTEETGVEWSELKELDAILDQIEEKIKNAHPREWVLHNMSDEYCASKFLNIIGIK